MPSRTTPPRSHTPDLLLCEQCGYPIQPPSQPPSLPPDQPTHQPICPECGKPTAESLPERRTGTPLTPHATWSASAWALLRTPNAVYARVAIDTKASGRFHTWTMLLTLLALASACAVLLVLVHWGELVWWRTNATMDYRLVVRQVIVWCVSMGVGYPLFLGLAAIERLGLRTIGHAHGYRITPTIAKVITDYASIGWLIGSALLVLSLLTWFAPPLYRENGLNPPLPLRSEVVLWYPVAAILIGLLVFETLAYIGLQRCKFANTPRTLR